MISGLMVGEIHTDLLQNSGALSSAETEELLALIPRHAVRTWERPIQQAASPEQLIGVDCELPSASRRRHRCIGTVTSEVWITGGQLVQSSSRTQVMPAEQQRRRPWSHYLSRPGVVESWAEAAPDDVIDGFLSPGRRPSELDLGGIAERALDSVQDSRLIDGRAPFRTSTSSVRWTAAPAAGRESILFTLEGPQLRTIRLEAASGFARLPELFADLARHEWLLSALIELTGGALGPRSGPESLGRLRLAVDHLLHTWMPVVRLPAELAAFWEEVERVAGFTRRWQAEVGRIRDQVALAAAEYLARGEKLITLPESGGSRTTAPSRLDLDGPEEMSVDPPEAR